MSFILTGFRQDMAFRVFAFERRETTRSRMAFTVKADLGLIRRYDIRVQELPLLCRSLLERQEAVESFRAETASDVETRALADTAVESCPMRHGAHAKKGARCETGDGNYRPPDGGLREGDLGRVRLCAAPAAGDPDGQANAV